MNIFEKILLRFISPIYRYFCKYQLRTWLVYGDRKRVSVGKRCKLANTLINVSSGSVTLGDDIICGHNVMIITGIHTFINGKRKFLVDGGSDAPTEGMDIHIGSGVWLASGAIISGGVQIGDNSIIAAGSIVVKDVESGCMVAGVPARIIKRLDKSLC